MGEADLTEGLVGSYLLPEQLRVAPAQALAPEIAAFRTGVFSPQPFPIEVDRAKAALMGQLQGPDLMESWLLLNAAGQDRGRISSAIS